MTIYFFERLESEYYPAGLTVSKNDVLPDGDFLITEFSWGGCTLWFIDADEFTDDERQTAYEAVITGFPAGSRLFLHE